MREQTIFEKIITGEIPCHKVYEDDSVLAFLSKGQLSKGHTLVVPKHHSRNILDIDEKDLTILIVAVKKIAKHLFTVLNASGFKIQQNNEPGGGQEVFHTHFHIIPTYNDSIDTDNVLLTEEELAKLSREIYLE